KGGVGGGWGGGGASGRAGAGRGTGGDNWPRRTAQFTFSVPAGGGFGISSTVVPAPTSPWSWAASFSKPCLHCTAVPRRAFVFAGVVSWYPRLRSLFVILPAAPDAEPALKTITRTSLRALAVPALAGCGGGPG